MTKSRIALFGSVMVGAVLLCGAGVRAQDYNYSNGPYNDAGYAPGNFDRSYDDRVGPVAYDDRAGPSETIIVHPNDVIEQQQLLGRVDGEINPQAYHHFAAQIDFSDLDLRRGADRAELHERIYQTASNLCAELDARVPGLSGDRSADQECVRDATRHAMEDVMDRYYG